MNQKPIDGDILVTGIVDASAFSGDGTLINFQALTFQVSGMEVVTIKPDAQGQIFVTVHGDETVTHAIKATSPPQVTASVGSTFENIAMGLANNDLLAITLHAFTPNSQNMYTDSVIVRFGDLYTATNGAGYSTVHVERNLYPVYLRRAGTTLQAYKTFSDTLRTEIRVLG